MSQTIYSRSYLPMASALKQFVDRVAATVQIAYLQQVEAQGHVFVAARYANHIIIVIKRGMIYLGEL